MNITRTPWAAVPSLPISTTYPKKRTTVSYQTLNPTLQTPSSPKHPGTDAREDPHHQMTREITIEHSHKALLPSRDEAEHHAPIEHRLIGAYHYDTCMHLCPYAPHRRRHGVDRGQPLIDPSPGTIPHICSPSPVLRECGETVPAHLQQDWTSHAASEPVNYPRGHGSDRLASARERVIDVHEMQTVSCQEQACEASHVESV